MTISDSLASLAFEEIAHRLFGPEAFISGFIRPEVSRWIRYTCANTFNRWRKNYISRVKVSEKLEVKVQESYESTLLSSIIRH